MLAILRPTKFWFFPLTRIGSCLSIAHQQSNLNSFGQYFGWSDPTGQLNYAVFAIILNNTCKLSKFENAVTLMISLTGFKLVFINQFPRSFLQFFTVWMDSWDSNLVSGLGFLLILVYKGQGRPHLRYSPLRPVFQKIKFFRSDHYIWNLL